MTSRALLLSYAPGTATELAAAAGLTYDNARRHLERLLVEGIVAKSSRPRSGGPPEMVYTQVQLLIDPEPRECVCCGRLRQPEEFYSGREGLSLCCKPCYASNPGGVAAVRGLNDKLKEHARRAKTARSDAWIVEYARLIAKDPCSYCGGRMTVIDHIEPLAHHGLHAWDNLTPACSSCNSRKSAKPLLLFLEQKLCD